MTTLLGICGAFLAAILWMDLMFDIQVIRAKTKILPENVLASLAAFYKQITTDADPMRNLITVLMSIMWAGLVYDLAYGIFPLWFRVVSFVLAVIPSGLAWIRTLNNGIRLGQRKDSIEVQSELAHLLTFDHIFCFVMISAFSLWQLFGALYLFGAS